jgi:hypothetical protein
MAEQHKTLVGFFIPDEFSEQPKFYVFKLMVLEIKSAVRDFTRLLWPVTTHLRKRGSKVIIYIDDLTDSSQPLQKAQNDIKVAEDVFQRAGWLFSNKQKSRAREGGSDTGALVLYRRHKSPSPSVQSRTHQEFYKKALTAEKCGAL